MKSQQQMNPRSLNESIPIAPHTPEYVATYDVVIVGGSFAGLATAMQLKGHRVLVIDQYPIGAHQSSTCGAPLRLAQMVGADDAIYEVHDEVVLHTAGRAIRFSLPEPYVTFNYEVFCQALLAHTEADVRLARATGYADGAVSTTAGPVAARYVVDATGWRSFVEPSVAPAGPMSVAGRGIETELPVRVDVSPGLHFFFERRLVPQGYAWIFPCGERTRIGVGSAAAQPHLRKRLVSFLEELGLEIGETHGGVMPVVRREPVAGDVFVVGDSAGQCLPVTAEGIRIAMLHGMVCGRLIAAALTNDYSSEEAHRRYREYVWRTNRFHRRLLKMQAVVERAPEWLLAIGAQACSPTPLGHRILNAYLGYSGWGLRKTAKPGRAHQKFKQE